MSTDNNFKNNHDGVEARIEKCSQVISEIDSLKSLNGFNSNEALLVIMVCEMLTLKEMMEELYEEMRLQARAQMIIGNKLFGFSEEEFDDGDE